MRRFKFGGFGGGNEDDEAPTNVSEPGQVTPEQSASKPPPSQAEHAPAGGGGESWAPSDGGGEGPTADEGSGGGSSWMPRGQEPFSSSDSDDEPAPIGGGDQQEHQAEAGWGSQDPQSGPEGAHADGDAADERGHADALDDHEPDTQAYEAPDEERPAERSRVSVVDEPDRRPAPPPGADEEEYRWHTYKHYPSGRPDAIEFIDTYKAFGRNKILRGVNMGLPEGMVSMILGPSGTGKSVCIKHMVGLLYPDEGDILVHGESVPNMPDDDLFEMRKKFGLLFQDGALFGSMDLYDNVAFPLRQHTEKGEDEIEDIVMRRLNEVGLGSAREKMPNELSGGMRKRAGFARALVLEPDIVLFDEPDSGLDPVRTALLGELILEIHRDMMDEAKEKQKTHLPTFAVITHDIMSARRVADYINVLWRGRIVEAGPAEDMLNSDNPFIRQFLAGESQGPLTMD
jgi:phospholipid/cholesterol/gamma-HCH transport system ATP-binding protein